MITITATTLRKNLFEYLDRAAAGETIVIQRNDAEVARLVGIQSADWREGLQADMTLLVDADTLMEPLDEVWAAYT